MAGKHLADALVPFSSSFASTDICSNHIAATIWILAYLFCSITVYIIYYYL